MVQPSRVVWHFVVFYYLLHHVKCRVYYNNVTVWYNLQETAAPFHQLHQLMEWGFGFLVGGEVHFSMTCPTPEPYGRPDFYLLFCSTAEARELTRLAYSPMTDCSHFLSKSEVSSQLHQAKAYCHRARITEQNTSNGKTLQPGQYVHQKRIMQRYFYTFILLQCQASDRANKNYSVRAISCQSTLVALNPGGVQLSSDEIPLPLIYTIINLIWATLVAAWFFNWVIYFKYSNRLHRLISCAPIFKVILVVLVLLWWQEIAHTGMESSDISSVRHFIQSIEDALLFIIMMVIAEGWGVIRSHTKHYRWTSLLLLFAMFATSLMCVHWVHRYFLAFSVCCVVFIMYKTLKWSSHNIELLRRRRRKIRRFITKHQLHHAGWVTVDMQLRRKLDVFRYFRIVCATFSMVYSIAVTLATFLHEYMYIKALAFEISELMVYVSIGVIFRLRNFEAYEHIELVPPRENVIILELPEVCSGQVEPHVVLGVPLQHKVEKQTQTPCRRHWCSKNVK